MRALVSAMPAYMKLSLATMLQYRGEILLWAIWGVVYPAVAMAMWAAAIKGTSAGTHIHGMDAHAFAAYFLLTMVVGHFSTAWDVYEMGYLVRTGAMSAKLLRPILPVWERLADNLAYKTLTLVVLIPIWAGVAFLAQPDFATNRTDLLLGIPAVLLGSALNFMWCYILGMLAFWVTRMDAVGEAWFAAGLFLGGRLAPLTIMPGPVQVLAALLPFKWIIYFPSWVLMGKLDTPEILAGIGWQLVWMVISLIAFRLVWRAGVKKYSAVGS